ncbi:site-specific tyrosine recombinase XerD [Mucilaginibacter panaciglaebae]|uniref:Site-specific tyrosine recombinase XerD n=2 Tax=Mucilaginibacter panaciglaebae TaxID=502331 RepID=A0ABP7WN03_9SPHI
MPKMLTEFLDFLEAKECNHPHDIHPTHINSYFEYLHIRPNRKSGGGLGKNYIRKQLQVINKFSRYLTESGKESFAVNYHIKGAADRSSNVLTISEVQQLFGATTEDVLGLRDKAMLALYYGCGLRKNEGVNVNVRDVLFDKDLVLVKKGKGYKERYVPLAGNNKADLENYICYSRPHLLSNKKEEALLINVKGKRLSSSTPYVRLQQLRAATTITKPVGVHTLRHSIASHLLQSGMMLEQIQRFLGHSSLESTQIYTHLKHENQS